MAGENESLKDGLQRDCNAMLEKAHENRNVDSIFCFIFQKSNNRFMHNTFE